MELFDIESNIEINKIFQRSTRLDSKLSEDYIKNYIFHDTSRSILNRIASSYLKSNQAAFTLTGPYGSGKSSLALFLNALVYHGNKIQKALPICSGFSIIFAFKIKAKSNLSFKMATEKCWVKNFEFKDNFLAKLIRYDFQKC